MKSASKPRMSVRNNLATSAYVYTAFRLDWWEISWETAWRQSAWWGGVAPSGWGERGVKCKETEEQVRSRAGCDIYMCEQTCSSKGATVLASGPNSIQAKAKRTLSLMLTLHCHTQAPDFLSQGRAKMRKLRFASVWLCFVSRFSGLVLRLGKNC